jgi:NADH:ubiquinone oxidoreductase subunit E
MVENCAVDLSLTDEILERYPAEEASLIQVLQDVQRGLSLPAL